MLKLLKDHGIDGELFVFVNPRFNFRFTLNQYTFRSRRVLFATSPTTQLICYRLAGKMLNLTCPCTCGYCAFHAAVERLEIHSERPYFFDEEEFREAENIQDGPYRRAPEDKPEGWTMDGRFLRAFAKNVVRTLRTFFELGGSRVLDVDPLSLLENYTDDFPKWLMYAKGLSFLMFMGDKDDQYNGGIPQERPHDSAQRVAVGGVECPAKKGARGKIRWKKYYRPPKRYGRRGYFDRFCVHVKPDETVDPNDPKVIDRSGARNRMIVAQAIGPVAKVLGKHPASFTAVHPGRGVVFRMGDMLEVDEKNLAVIAIELAIIRACFEVGKHKYKNPDGTPVFTPGHTVEENATNAAIMLLRRIGIKLDIKSFDGAHAMLALLVREIMAEMSFDLVMSRTDSSAFMRRFVMMYRDVVAQQNFLNMQGRGFSFQGLYHRASGSGATSFANQLVMFCMLQTAVAGDYLCESTDEKSDECFLMRKVFRSMSFQVSGDDTVVALPLELIKARSVAYGSAQYAGFRSSLRRLKAFGAAVEPYVLPENFLLEASFRERLVEAYNALGMTCKVEAVEHDVRCIPNCRNFAIRTFPDRYMLVKDPLDLLARLTNFNPCVDLPNCATIDAYIASVAISYGCVNQGVPVLGQMWRIHEHSVRRHLGRLRDKVAREVLLAQQKLLKHGVAAMVPPTSDAPVDDYVDLLSTNSRLLNSLTEERDVVEPEAFDSIILGGRTAAEFAEFKAVYIRSRNQPHSQLYGGVVPRETLGSTSETKTQKPNTKEETKHKIQKNRQKQKNPENLPVSGISDDERNARIRVGLDSLGRRRKHPPNGGIEMRRRYPHEVWRELVVSAGRRADPLDHTDALAAHVFELVAGDVYKNTRSWMLRNEKISIEGLQYVEPTAESRGDFHVAFGIDPESQRHLEQEMLIAREELAEAALTGPDTTWADRYFYGRRPVSVVFNDLGDCSFYSYVDRKRAPKHGVEEMHETIVPVIVVQQEMASLLSSRR